MPTTTKMQDYLGRWLNNTTPGTTNATDNLGRAVVAGDKDYAGRSLTFTDPGLFAATTAYTVNQFCRLSTGEILQATVAGTSAASAPSPPALYATVVSGGVTFRRMK